MIFDKGLKGTDLLVYAIIAKCKDEGGFDGSLQYLTEWTNSTKPSVIKSLKYLTERNLIEKSYIQYGGKRTIVYQISGKETLPNGKEILLKGKKTLPLGKETLPKSKETLPQGKEILPKTPDSAEIEKSKKEKYQKKEVKEICDIEAISSNTLQKNIDTAISQSKDSDDIVIATSKNTTNDTTNPKNKINNKNKKLTKPELDALKAKMIDEYTSNEKLKSAIREYDLMREQTHKPIATEYTMKLVFRNLNRLAPLSDEDKIKVLEQSILKNWQGLFPVKDDGVREMTEAEIADQKILDKIFG